MINWNFFDIYNIQSKYYGYSIEDYFIMQKEFWRVFVDVSIETVAFGLPYWVSKIIVLDYDNKQLEVNIKKRIKERNYSNEEIGELLTLIEKEKKYLNKLKNQYDPQKIFFIKNVEEFEVFLYQ
jgi:hypothetical protein